MGRDALMQALWSLKEDAAWAWKDALEGHPVDVHKLGLTWKRVEQAVMEEERESLYRSAVQPSV
jgi:hypothetical protein